MDTQPLFLDSPLTFEGADKYAGMMTRLGDSTDMWPQEIMQEAYKQLPYISDFEVNVILDKVDEERGYAFGSLEVRPKTAMNPDELEVSPLQKVNIPVVVRDHQLAPLDIFMKGKGYQHLTEGRLRTALLRPDMFDAARKRPPDPHLHNDLRPPMMDSYGGYGKMGHVLPQLPILPQLNGRVSPRHQERLFKLAEDPSMRTSMLNAHEGVQAAFLSAMRLEPSDRMKTASALSDNLPAKVVQMRRAPNGSVMVKWANPFLYAPREEEIPLDVAQDMAGEVDIVPMMEADGTVTMSPDAPVKQTLESEEVSNADKFGLWQVQDMQGNELIGWVFPQLLSLDMIPLPLSLFTNGSSYAVQDKIAGKIAGKTTDIPKGVPKGYGALYYIDHGTAKAFVPMNVTTTSRTPEGLQYFADTDTGEKVRFSFAHGIKNVVKVSEDEYVVPDSVSWMPLRGQTELVPEAHQFAKVSNDWRSTIEIVGDRTHTYSFRGAPVQKIASDQTKFLNRHQAEFLGVALGMDPAFVKEALDQASWGSTVTVPGVRTLESPREKFLEKKAQLQKYIDDLEHPIHNYFLAKEASILDDALTADRILGLGFLNAENISTFVDMLPALEETSSKLAELLMAVRVGMKDIPEVAVERMLCALEDVIRGLKSLQQKELSFAS